MHVGRRRPLVRCATLTTRWETRPLAFNPTGPLLFLAMHQFCYTSIHVTLPEPSVSAEQAHKEGGGRHAHFQVGNVNVMAALHKPPLLNLQVLLSPCS